MDRNTLIAIFKQAVADMAYQAGLQLNTFAVLDDAPDLVHDAMGFTYDNYLAGEFWSRFWVGNGADPAKIKADFPVLFVEEGAITQECADSWEYRQEWPVLVIDKIECTSCPPGEDRSAETIKANTRTMLRNWLKEVSTYRLAEVDNGVDIIEQWISAGRQEYLDSLPGTTVGGIIEDLYSIMVGTPIKIEEVGAWDDFKAHRAILAFELCEAPAGVFNYKDQVLPELAIIRRPC